MPKSKVKSYLDPMMEVYTLHRRKRISKCNKNNWKRLGKKKK